ncbi:MAG TPA: hypothetical protein VG756_05840 [Pseudonocardiaceae bacterium]|jgi:hypothetical protein|nr:hypothetical protein [Pseudonocardiaceae bacterium]
MPRPSPFTDLPATEQPAGPAEDAVVVELGRPSGRAYGCFGLTTAFLAVVALAAVVYAALGPRAASSQLRGLAAVLGVIFLAFAAWLVLVGVRAVRARHGLALDADAVWWRRDAVLVRLPWTELAAARMVQPIRIKGLRSSAPPAPAVQFSPVDEAALRRYPQLVDAVTAGEPLAEHLPRLRYTFRLVTPADGQAVAAALARFVPDKTLPDTDDAPEGYLPPRPRGSRRRPPRRAAGDAAEPGTGGGTDNGGGSSPDSPSS